VTGLDYLLDTNACIAVINGAPAPVRARLRKAVDDDAKVSVSSLVTFELWHWAARSARPELNEKRVTTFLCGPLTVLPFEEEDSRIAGSIRAALEELGKPIGAYDLLIAGQALSRGLTLVTANIKEFSRVKGLSWQDWAKNL
jgi:tRNA(fMet)-specific endonuclease VapC